MYGAEKLDRSVIALLNVVLKPSRKRIGVIHSVHKFRISVNTGKIRPVSAVVIIIRKRGLLHDVSRVFVERIYAERTEIACALLLVVFAFEESFHIFEHALCSVVVGDAEEYGDYGIDGKVVFHKLIALVVDVPPLLLVPEQIVDGFDYLFVMLSVLLCLLRIAEAVLVYFAHGEECPRVERFVIGAVD